MVWRASEAAIAIVEAAYRLEPGHDAWLRGIACAVDRGLGAVACAFAPSAPPTRVRVGAARAALARALGRSAVARLAPCCTASHAKLRIEGAEDALVLTAIDADAGAVVIAAPLASARPASRAEARLWTAVAPHVLAAWRLRRRVAAHELRAAALLAERQAVRGGSSLWATLARGDWSVVDRFEAHGRRYFVASRNPPPLRDPRALTAREHRVLSAALEGQSLKQIAGALGWSISTVAAHRARAVRKLGLRSVFELPSVFAEAP